MGSSEYKSKIKKARKDVWEKICSGIEMSDSRETTNWLFILDKLDKRVGEGSGKL